MKRFTETEKWRDPWFQKLDKESRTLWGWLCDRVDNAGVIDICWPICNAETLGSFSDDSMQAFGDRVEKLENGKWWIPKFTGFQFGDLSESPKNKVHQSVKRLLDKYSLYDRVCHRLYHTPKDKEKEKDKEKDSVKLSKGQRIWFDQFYEKYPKSSDKPGCLKVWSSLDVTYEMLQEMLKSIDKSLKSESWKDPEYIPLPLNWLEKRRWEDKIKSNGSEHKIPSSKEFREAL